MSTLVVALLVVEPIAMIGLLGLSIWHLSRLEQGWRSLSDDYRQLRRELKAAHREHEQTVECRLVQTEEDLAWMLPWVRHWATLAQRQTRPR